MNTTMADGAAQRLVAQIAADLFGQPGLTLMELAGKVKEARNNDVPLGYVRVEAIKALREDDEVTGVMVHVEERADSVPVYLAARQPVEAEENVAADTYWTVAGMIEPHIQDGALPASVHDSVAILLDHWLKTRQPVGQEPVVEPVQRNRCKDCGSCDLEWSWANRIRNNVVQGRLTISDVECVFYLGCNECSATVMVLPAHNALPILAAPPAQAVDQGRWSQGHAEDLEQAIHTALSAHAGSLSQKKRKAISDYVKRLLIDSQAVAMADQLLTSTPVSPHQLAEQRFNFVSRVFAGSHRNVQANLTRSVDHLEASKRAFSGAIQRNSNGYITRSDLEVPILVPADFFCHALPLQQNLSFLSIHKAPTTPNGLNNG